MEAMKATNAKARTRKWLAKKKLLACY
jgi:hypothetical protein